MQSGQKDRKGCMKGGTQHAKEQLKQCVWSMGVGQFWTNPQGKDRCWKQARVRVGIHLDLFLLPQVMVTNVTSLLKTVKAVEDEATKGTRALEATIEHIRQELAVSEAAVLRLLRCGCHSPATPCLTTALASQVFSSPVPPAKVSTPEDFIRMTKGITMATAKAVAAGNSCRQEDVIATANLSRRAIADMLRSCKVGWAAAVGL